MIINRVLFLAFLTFVNSFGVFGAAAASSESTTAAPFVFAPEKVSCIHILPFTQVDGTEPDTHTAMPASSVADKPTTDVIYHDKFGEGKLFKSVPFKFTALDRRQDVGMMHALVDYTKQHFCKDEIGKTIAPKNTCMVRICVTLEGGVNVLYNCGLYVSGFDNYQRGTIEDCFLHPGEKQQHKELRDINCKAAIQKLESVEGGLEVVIKFSGITIPAGKSCVDGLMDKRHSYMYYLPHFLLGNVSFHPSSWFLQAKKERRETPDKSKDYKWLEEKIKERLFFGAITDHKQSLKDAKKPENHMAAIRKKYEDDLGKDEMCFTLFERTGLSDPASVHSCFRTEKVKDAESGGLPYYFNDSEQVFLSFLQLADKDTSDTLTTIKRVTEKYNGDTQRKAVSISLDFYSFFDMCRFCRGTLSQVLSNGFLHTHLTELLKKERVSMDRTTLMNIHAFGYDRNVNKGEK